MINWFGSVSSKATLNQLEDMDLRAGIYLIIEELKRSLALVPGSHSTFMTQAGFPVTITPNYASYMHEDLITALEQQIRDTQHGFFLGIYDASNGHFIPFIIYCLKPNKPAIITIDPLARGRAARTQQARRDFARVIEGNFDIVDLNINQQTNSDDCGFFSLQTLEDLANDICLNRSAIITLNDEGKIFFNRKNFTFIKTGSDSSRRVRQIWTSKLSTVENIVTYAADGEEFLEEYSYENNKSEQLDGDKWQTTLKHHSQWFKQNATIQKYIHSWLRQTGLMPQIYDYDPKDLEKKFYAYLQPLIPKSHPLAEFFYCIDDNPKKFEAFRAHFQAIVNEMGINFVADLVDGKLQEQTFSLPLDLAQLARVLNEQTITLGNQKIFTLQNLLEKSNIYNQYCQDVLPKLRYALRKQACENPEISDEAESNHEDFAVRIDALSLLLSSLRYLVSRLEKAIRKHPVLRSDDFEELDSLENNDKDKGKKKEKAKPLVRLPLDEAPYLLLTVRRWVQHLSAFRYDTAHYQKFTCDVASYLKRLIQPYLDYSQEDLTEQRHLRNGVVVSNKRKAEIALIEAILLPLAVLLELPTERRLELELSQGTKDFYHYHALLVYTITTNLDVLRNACPPLAEPISLQADRLEVGEVDAVPRSRSSAFPLTLSGRGASTTSNARESSAVDANPFYQAPIKEEGASRSMQSFGYAFTSTRLDVNGNSITQSSAFPFALFRPTAAATLYDYDDNDSHEADKHSADQTPSKYQYLRYAGESTSEANTSTHTAVTSETSSGARATSSNGPVNATNSGATSSSSGVRGEFTTMR